jgi:DNA-binding PadR family transcriptional regulator
MSQKKHKANNEDSGLSAGLLKLYLLNAAGEKALTVKSAVERLAVRGHRTSEPAILAKLGALQRAGLLRSTSPNGSSVSSYALTRTGRAAVRDLKPHLKGLIETMAD